METINSSKIATSHAHSKLILIGEHAVVYGKPAIAIPFPLQVTSTIESWNGEIMLVSSLYFGPMNKVPAPLQGIALCIKKTLSYLKKPLRGIRISLQSDIPLGRGLGSSAAIAIAIVKGLFSFYEKPLLKRVLMELVKVAEVHAHGNPSGIDMAAASSEFPILFQKSQATSLLPVGAPLHLVVADSGKVGDTLSAVQKVRENYQIEYETIESSMERIEKLAELARVALLNGNIHLLGRLLDENHQELRTIGVSDSRLDLLVETAKKKGALGAKLTGAGCGGCMLALAHSLSHAEQMSKSLLKAGAQKTWFFTIEKSYGELRDIYQ